VHRLIQSQRLIRFSIFLICALPVVILGYRYQANSLGINPFSTLMESSGFWSMLFLLITLGITPVRRWLSWIAIGLTLSYGKRLADWNLLIKIRRMLGLWCFFYTCLHLYFFLDFELAWSVDDLVDSLSEQPFILAGVVTWLMLLLLALTSPMAVRSRMGRHWRRLHRLMYVLPLTAIIHLFLEAKPTDYSPNFYMVAIILFLGHRLVVSQVKRLKRANDTGLEVRR